MEIVEKRFFDTEKIRQLMHQKKWCGANCWSPVNYYSVEQKLVKILCSDKKVTNTRLYKAAVLVDENTLPEYRTSIEQIMDELLKCCTVTFEIGR